MLTGFVADQETLRKWDDGQLEMEKLRSTYRILVRKSLENLSVGVKLFEGNIVLNILVLLPQI
jgi:hypothetical protein